jgi:FkbM family methyltransferase
VVQKIINRILGIAKRLNNKKSMTVIESQLNSYSKRKGKVRFIQIGSNDGITNDPITKYVKKNYTGVLVEPVPYLFEKLKKNYSKIKNRLFFENSAIASKDGEAYFYRLKDSDNCNLPAWYDQLGSFNKDVVLQHRKHIPEFDELFVEEIIKTISFESLLKKYGLKKIDLIHIDTEGYDYEIIKLIDFNKLEVEVLLFEHKHLSSQDQFDAINYLMNLNYNLISHEGDTLAIKKQYLI